MRFLSKADYKRLILHESKSFSCNGDKSKGRERMKWKGGEWGLERKRNKQTKMVWVGEHALNYLLVFCSISVKPCWLYLADNDHCSASDACRQHLVHLHVLGQPDYPARQKYAYTCELERDLLSNLPCSSTCNQAGRVRERQMGQVVCQWWD